MALPDFIPPMLAKLGDHPFDSDEHLFEIKWDGIRAVSFTEGGSYRAFTRNRNPLTERYPEFTFLSDLDEGFVFDGELVVLREGKPDFHAVLQREQARNKLKIEGLTRTHPVSYVVFDILYANGQSVCELPLTQRRELLSEIVTDTGHGRFILSDGIVGAGTALFEQCRAMGLEGMVAKLLRSKYHPGRRSESWTKVKCTQETVCAILGYLEQYQEVRSVIVALEENGQLVCAGRVGSGLSGSLGKKLYTLFQDHRADEPLIQNPHEGQWLEPGLFCKVRYLERTKNGLRAPVFLEMYDEKA